MKHALFSALIISTTLSQATPLVNGLGGDAGFGELSLDRNDDDSSGAIDITSVFPNGLNLFGQFYTSIYLNNNGNITLNYAESQYTPFAITGSTDNPIFAPFFADVDTRGGAVSQTPGGNSTGSNRVFLDLDAAAGIVTATWDDVGYYSQKVDKVNAFQLRLINRGGDDFDIEYRYETINWTTGDASEGVDGLGGVVATAGWSSGDGENFIQLPQSSIQDAMLNLENNPGIINFPVRSGEICNLSPVPSQLKFGGVPVNEQRSIPVSLTNNEPTDATIQSVVIVNSAGNPVPSPRYSIISDSLTGRTLGNGQSGQLTVRFRPTALANSSNLLRITTICDGNPVVLDLPMDGVGSTRVDIPDPALEECLREILDRPLGPLTAADLETIRSLDLRDKFIRSIEGLQAATNLGVLDLRRNQLIDLGRTFVILDQLPLYCLYRDFARPVGNSVPNGLTESSVTAVGGTIIWITIDLTELETLNVNDGTIDPTDADNLAVFQELEQQGVILDTGNLNIPPAAGGTVTRIAPGSDSFSFDASSSGDIDGNISSYLWVWRGGSSTEPVLTQDLPRGVVVVTLQVTDDDGAQTTRFLSIDNGINVNVTAKTAIELCVQTEAGFRYRVEYSTTLNNDWSVVPGMESLAGTGAVESFLVATQGSGSRELYRVVAFLE